MKEVQQTLKFLGRGSAFNVNEKTTSAYFIIEKTLYLIDCGYDTFKSIMKHNILDGISTVNVMITHLHDDHVGSLSSLIMYCHYVLKIIPNVMYGHNNDKLKSYLQLTGAFSGVHYNSVDSIRDSKVSILAICCKHKSIYKAIYEDDIKVGEESLFDSYSYLIHMTNNGETKCIFYSGDNNEIDPYAINKVNTIDEWYQDLCMADYHGNVHMNIHRFIHSFNLRHIHKVFAIHIDSDKMFAESVKYGFNVVKTIDEEGNDK